MGGKLLVILELLLVFGGLLGFGVHQLVLINRRERREREAASGAPAAPETAAAPAPREP